MNKTIYFTRSSSGSFLRWLTMMVLLVAGSLYTTNVSATTCPNAIAISSGLNVTNQTIVCGTVNDLTSTSVVSVCGGINYYGGLEGLYTYTPSRSGLHTISVSGVTYTGIMVYSGCPTTAGTTCVGNVQSSTATKSVDVTLAAGQTYFLMFDTWPSPNSPCDGGTTTFSIVAPLAPCTPPTDLATNLQLGASNSTEVNVVFNAASPAVTGYLVVRYPAGAVTTAPSNGLVYTAGNAIGLGTVVAAGAAVTTTTVTGLNGNTNYDFYVYSYTSNTGTCTIAYSTTALSGSVTTPACSPLPSNQPTGLSLTVTDSRNISGSFSAAASAPNGYLVVRYPAGAATTEPGSNTIYVAGNSIGAGTVVQASASLSFTASGLNDNTAYDFYVYSYLTGVGAGTCSRTYLPTSPLTASATTPPCSLLPANQPTALVLTPLSTIAISGSFTAAASTPTNYLVVRYPAGAATTAPVTGATYSAGGALGLGTVVQVTNATTFTATGLTATTAYDFYVYSYNSGDPVCVNAYRAASPLSGSATTNSPSPATCATAYVPANNATGVATQSTLSWTGVTGDPVPTYDVYFSTDQTKVTNLDPTVRVATNQSATTFTTSVLPYTTNYYWTVIPKNNVATATGCVVNKFTTQAPGAPSCVPTYSPVNGATGVAITGTVFTWTGATGSPGILGYDVYFGTDSALVASRNIATRAAFGVNFTSGAFSIAFTGNTKYFWVVDPANTYGRAVACPVQSFTTNATSTKTAVVGGLWSNPRTWGGTTFADRPKVNDDVVIPDGVVITVDTIVSVNNLTIGQSGTGKSVLQWNGSSNAITILGNLNISSNGNFLPYTTGGAGQAITIGGNVVNNGFANLAATGTALNFAGSQLGGGSLTQEINGSGTFAGTGSEIVLSNLQIATTGSVTLNTGQNIVVTGAFNDYAGTLVTNSKLRIDNTALVHGQAFNTQVASIAVTNMGTSYGAAPVVFGNSVTPWPASGAALSVSTNTRYFYDGNVYQVISGASSPISTGVGPTSTTPASSISAPTSSGTLTVLWLGALGNLGNPYTTGGTLTAGTQYFYGNNLYMCTVSGTGNVAGAPVHTSGTATVNTATLLYVGTVANATVNYDATSLTVRSLNLTNTGSGYLTTAPAAVISSSNGTGSGAVATAVMFQSIQGSTATTTIKSPGAVISGSININSGGATTAHSGVGSVYVTNGGVNYTVNPTGVGFSLPTGINVVNNQGAGYVSTPTVNFTPAGGSGTVTVADGKIVSIYLSGGNYTSWPTITLTGGGFTTAATILAPSNFTDAIPNASPVVDPVTRQISSFTVTKAGYGYLTAPTVTLNGGTATTVASGITARIGLYNLSYIPTAPSTSSPLVSPPTAEMPVSNKVNNLVVGNNTASGFATVKLGSNLDIMGTLGFSTSTVTTPSLLDLNNKTLTFSNQGYGGVGGTVFGSASGGDIVFRSIGGNVTKTFPWDAPVVVATGGTANVLQVACNFTSGSTTINTANTASIAAGMFVSGTGIPTGASVVSVSGTSFTINIVTTSAATVAAPTTLTFSRGASTISQLTGSRVGAATGNIVGGIGTAVGNRAYRVQAVGAMGAAGSVGLNYNVNDVFGSPIQQTALFVGQSGAHPVGTWTVKSTSSGTVNTLVTTSNTNVSRTTATTVPGLPTPVDLTQGTYFSWVATSNTTDATSTATGGNWNDPATWLNNVVPSSNDNVVIADGATVTVNQVVNVKTLTVGGNGSGAVLNWNATANAMTIRNNLTVKAGAKLNVHTTANPAATVTLNIGGNLKIDGNANLAIAVVNFTGSTLTDGSLTQEFEGAGTLIGDTISGGRGIIRTLQLASVGGSLSLGNWAGAQKIVVNNFLNLFAGTLTTGGKLIIDNTAISYGQNYNKSVASIGMTNMGATFSQAPVVFGDAVLPAYVGLNPSTNTYIYNPATSQVYLVTSGAAITVLPTATTSTTFTTSGPTLLHVGALGTIGETIKSTVVVGRQYQYKGNLYVATATTGNVTSPPIHTSGVTGSFRYIGTAATASVNYNATTRNVRSIAITDAGSGYLGAGTPSTAPAVIISPGGVNATQTTNATAIAVVNNLLSSATAISTTVRSTGTSISGGIASINSSQSVGSVSYNYGGVNYNAVPPIGFALPTGFQNLVTAQGSGYSGTLTFTVNGGTQVNAGTAPTFTGIIASGKVVSVICTGGGTGWLTQPTSITITGSGGGTGATASFPANALAQATVILSNDPLATTGSITDVRVTNGGSGYVSAPTVLLGTTGVTSASAAATPVIRVGLYELSYTLTAPSTAATVIVESAEVPTQRRVNKFTMNNASNATFTDNLEIYGNSTPLALTNGKMNFASGKTLLFSHPSYRGITGSLTSSVNGDMRAILPGGPVTQTFPYEASVVINTGTTTAAPADATTGSTVTDLTLKVGGAPSGSNGPVGTRSYEVLSTTGSVWGVNPTVQLNYNANDGLSGNNADLFIAQSTAENGPTWTIRSLISGTGALSATGTRTTTNVAGPTVIVPTNDDHYAWVSPVPVITNATVPTGGNCTPTAQLITADINFLTAPATTNPAFLYWNIGAGLDSVAMVYAGTGTSWSATIPPAATSNTVVTWSIKATNDIPYTKTFTGTAYTDSVFTSVVTINKSKESFCGDGGVVTLTASTPVSGVSYTWSSSATATLSTTSGATTTATLTGTSDFTVTATKGGCSSRTFASVGVYPFPSSTPFATPSRICVQNTAEISSGLSASNFSVAPIIYNRLPIPDPATVTNFTTLINQGAEVSVPGIPTNGTVTGDGGWNNIPIGFTFNYFGVDRTVIGMTTKAVLFMANDNSSTQYNFPPGFPSTSNPANVIAFLAADYQPGRNNGPTAGSIRFWTQGIAPNRMFVMDYDNIAGWSSGASSAQCILFETTGNVEVHVTYANAASTFSTPNGVKYIGLQESTRTIGATAPNTLTGQPNFWNGTDATISSTAPLAWRFTPPHPYQVNYTSSNGGFVGASSGANLFTATALPTTPALVNYNITYTDQVTGCSNSTSPATVSLRVVSKPVTPVITSPISICGTQDVILSIINGTSVAPGDVVRWYSAATGGSLLGQGLSYTAQNVASSTTIYVGVENTSCSSPRVPVVINVTQPPVLVVSNPTICGINGVQITRLSVYPSANLGNYDTYAWAPTSDLYQDAAATIQYTGQNLSTVYAKTNSNFANISALTPRIYTHTVSGYNFATGCSNEVTSTLTVHPPAGVAKITSSVPFICVSEPATLTVSPTTSTGTIQWEASTNNITFTAIPSATANTYLTDILSTSGYYRVAFLDTAGNACAYSDTLFLAANNPQVATVTPGSVCGGGGVVLSATANNSGTLYYYTSETGGTAFASAIASGASVTSPAITTSPTTFWVAASVNGCIGTRTSVEATITSPSSITVSPVQSVCAGGVATVSVSNNTDYNNWTWSPFAEIYSNPAGTSAITGTTSLQTVYIKPVTPGLNSYTVTASKTGTAACTTTGVAQVNVLPATATVTANPTAICPNGTADLGITAASSLAGASYQWEISTAGVGGPYTPIVGATSASYTTLAANATQWYQCVIKNSAGVTCFTTAPYELGIVTPTVLSTTNNSRCTSGTLVLSATGSAGTTLNWYSTSSSNTVLSTNASYTTPILAASTSYWVAAVVGTCASARVEVFATINTAPALTVTSAQNACNNAYATITASGYTSYSWSGPAGTLYADNTGTLYTGQDQATVFARSTTVSNKTYTVIATNPTTGCTATTTTTVRTIPASATIAAAPAAICAGGSSIISITPSTGYGTATIQWQSSSTGLPGSFSNVGTGNSYNTGAVSTTTYYQAEVNGCFTTSALTLSVDNPILVSTTPGSACGTSIVALSATGSAGTTLNWYDAATGGTLVGTGSTFYTPAISSTTTYYVEAAFGTTCASARTAVTATINSSAVSPVTVNADQTICNGAVATLSTPSTVDYDTYVWAPAAGLYTNSNGTGAYAGANLLTVYASNTVAGTYSYYVTASNTGTPGCSSTAITTVTVLPADGEVFVTSSIDTICNSGSATLTVAPASGYGAGAIEWQSSTDNINFSAAGSSSATYVASGLTSTRYFRAVIKNGATSCTISDTATVVVLTPTVASVTSDQRCGNGSVTLFASAASGTTLKWYTTLGGSTLVNTGVVYNTPSLIANTSYFVAASIGSCISNAVRTEVTATINAPSPVSVSAAAATVCNGGIVALTVANNPDYDTWTWPLGTGELYQDAGGNSLYQGQSQQTVYVKSTTSGTKTYTVTTSNSAGSCSNTANVSVIVLPTSLTITPSSTICVTGSTTLSFPTTGFGNATFSWESSPTGSAGSFTATGATGSSYVTPTVTSTTYYRVVVTSAASATACFTSAAYELKVSNPLVSSTGPGNRCGTGTVGLSAASSTAGATFAWYDVPSGGTALSGTGSSFTTPSISATTNYYVSAVSAGCEGTRVGPVVATVNAAPAITASSNQTVCNNQFAPITASYDAAYNDYRWTRVTPTAGTATLKTTNSGAGVQYTGGDIESGGSVATLYARSTDAGNNQYRVTASNTNNGCSVTAVTTVIVQPGSFVVSSIPEAICVSGVAELKLTPSPSTNVEWDSSTVSASGPWFTIPGATNPVYNTDSITQTVYYRAIVRNDDGTACTLSPASVKTLSISNPSITSTGNAERCGTGAISLSATASAGATVYWYTALTGGTNSFVAQGPTYNIPSVSATTVYYLSAGIGDCYSTRTAAIVDSAIINNAPLMEINETQTVCNSSTPFELTLSALSNSASYSDYVWSYTPTTGPNKLFIDTAGLIPYNSAIHNTSTVYALASTVGTTTYTLNASDATSQCSATDNVTLTVLPGAASATVTANPTVLCISDDATLTLAGGSSYPAGAIQWQGSTTGLPGSFTNISLANAAQYTTIIQSTVRYYQVQISNSTGAACFTSNPVTTLDVVNPQVTSTAPITRCGPATSQVSATVTAGSSIAWYPSETSNTVLSTSGTYVTPVIRETTTYWVGAVNGTCNGGRTAVTVTYVDPPTLNITADQKICAGVDIAMVTTTAGTDASFTNFLWTSDSALYTDAAATILYNPATDNVNTVYTKGQGGFTLVNLFAWDGAAGTPTSLTSCVNSKSTLVTFVKVDIASVTSAPAVVCAGSDVVLTALGDPIIGTGPQTQPVGYLASSATSTADEEIYGVTLKTLANTSVCSSVGPGPSSVNSMYSNYTTLPATTVSIGEVLTGSLDLGYCASFSAYSNTANVYFDWNRDGDFLDANETKVVKAYGPHAIPAGFVTPYTFSVNYPFTVTVPANAQPGVTRMRVVNVESTVISSTGTYSWGETEDYLINIRSFVQPTYNYSWNSGTPSTNNTLTDFVGTTPQIYTVLATDPETGCSGTLNYTVTPTAGPAAPTATNTSQCGFGIPTASVSSNSTAPSPRFTWFSSPTAATIAQVPGATSGSATYLSPISATTTFYVAEFDGACNSYPRTPLTVTVTNPDAVTASASAPACLGSDVTLTATQVGSTNTYTYTWSASPSLGSGLVGSPTGASVVATPTAIGTYVYTVTAFDAGTNCTTLGTVTVTVTEVPAVSLTPATATTCQGTPVQLLATQTNGGGNSIQLNGTDQWLAIPSSPSIDFSSAAGSSFTLEAWIRPTTATINAGIISKYQTATTASYFLRQGSVSPFTGIGAGANTQVLTTPNTGVYTLNTWNHVAAVYTNVSNASNTVDIYVNGVLRGTGSVVVPSNTDSIRIGSDFSARFFNGQIDEVRIWNSALSATTLNAYKSIAVDATHPNFANLAAYYNFNQLATATTIADLSGNGNTATVRGTPTLEASAAPVSNNTTTYAWTPATGLSNAAIANPVALPSTTTDYIVTVTNSNGCSTTDTVTVNILTSPGTVTIASSQTAPICVSGSATLNINSPIPGVTYQWQSSATGNVNTWNTLVGETGTSYTTPNISATTYYRAYATCGVGAADTSAAFEQIVSNPSIISAPNVSRCGAGSVDVVVTPNAGSVVNWFTAPSGGTSIYTGNTYTANLTSTTTYYVEAAAPGSANVTGLGNTVQPNSVGFNIQRGIQFNATQSFTLVSADFWAGTAGSGTAAVVLLDNNLATVASINVPVTASAIGFTTVPLNLNITPGTGYRLLATFTGITNMGGTTTGVDYNSPAFNNLGSVGTITAGIESGGVGGTVSSTVYYYFYNLAITAGCSGPRQAVTATATPAPAITATANSLPAVAVCPGAAVTLNVTSPNPDYTYVWNGTLNGPTHTVNPTSTTTYTVTAIDNSANEFAGCGNVRTVTVTVNPGVATPIVTPAADTVCIGSPVTLTLTNPQVSAQSDRQIGAGVTTAATSGVSPYDGLWEGAKKQYLYTAAELSAAGLVAGNLNAIKITNQTTLSVPLTNYTISIGTTTASDLSAGYVTSGLTPKFTSPAYSVVVGTNVHNLSSPFYWDGTSNLVVDICFDNDVAGTCTGGSGVCYSSVASTTFTTTAFVSVRGNYGDNSGAVRDMCAGGTGTSVTSSNRPNITFTGETASAAPSTYAWTPSSVSGNSITASPTTNTTYTVTGTNSFGCTSATSVDITVVEPAQPVLSQVSQVLCPGDEVFIGVSDAGVYSTAYPAGTLVDWYGIGGSLIAQNLAPTATISSSLSTEFYATVKLPNACSANTSTITIESVQLSVSTVMVQTSCAGNDGSITATATGVGPFTYVWKDALNAVVQTTTNTVSTTDVYSGLSAGTYSVEVTGNVGGANPAIPVCTTPKVFTTVTGSVPYTVAASSTAESCPGLNDGSILLIVTGGSGNFTYSWNSGAYTTASVSGLGQGVYNYVVTDVVSGCSTAGSVTVTGFPAVVFDITTTNVSCFGLTDGTASFVPGAGSPTVLFYDWLDNTSTSVATSSDITTAAAGTYTVSAFDENGCVQTSQPVVITQPAEITVTSLTPSSGNIGTVVTIAGTGFTGASGVSFNGTPAVTFTVNSATSITATVPVGTTTGNVTVFVGACSGTSTSPFTVTVPSFTTFNVTAFIQGYYIGSSTMNSVLSNQGVSSDPLECDTIIVNLIDPLSTSTIVESHSVVLATDGTGQANFSAAIAGNSYYVSIQHRSALVTYSALPVTFTSTTSYDFTSAASQAFGDNMKDNGDGTWSIYNGDVIQDGFISSDDAVLVDDDNIAGVFGVYAATDINGDGFVSSDDAVLTDENNINGIFVAQP